MKLAYIGSITMHGLDGSKLRVEYDNMGEPFREGIRLTIEGECDCACSSVLLNEEDAATLQDVLRALLCRPNLDSATPESRKKKS